jgi:PPOX class probable F420-dependent enzyme
LLSCPTRADYGRPMDLDEARAIIREQQRAVLATVRDDGTPQMSPVLVAVDDDGRVLVSTRETAVKVRNLRRDARLWLCVLPDGFFGRWVQVEGRAEIVAQPEALDGLVDYYRRVAGEHENWDDYREAMQRERRVLLRVVLDRAGPDRAG